MHLGPGPFVDPIHEISLKAALLSGQYLEGAEPGESEDFGVNWSDPLALTYFGERTPTEEWTWTGPARTVTGRTWGGCIEALQQILAVGRFPADSSVLEGGVLLLESSEELLSAREFGRMLRVLGERGVLGAVDAVVVARPSSSSLTCMPSPSERRDYR